MKSIVTFILLFWVLLVLNTLAQAANTYWVRPSGTMSGCTASVSAPGANSGYKATIAAGISCLSSGDMLNIRTGTYKESILDTQFAGKSGGSYSTATIIRAYQTEIVTLQGSITFSAAPGVTTRYVIFQGDAAAKNFVIDGGSIQVGQAGNTGFADHIKFDGLEIKNPSGGPGQAAVIQTGEAANSDNWFTNIHIHNAVATLCNSGGPAPHGFYIQSPNNLIENTEIDHLAGYGVQNYDQASGSASRNVYRSLYIHDTGFNQPGACIQSTFALGLITGVGNVAYNNILANNSNGVDLKSGSPDNAFYSNTLYSNGPGNQSGDPYPAINAPNQGTGLIIRNNILWANSINAVNTSGGSAVADHNSTINPNFVNAAGGDFHLQATSAVAIDQGTALCAPPCAYSVDYAGTARPQGASNLWDIGAYEFVSATLPTVVINQPAGCVGNSTACTVNGTPLTLTGTSSLP